jgi:hypothetical protein
MYALRRIAVFATVALLLSAGASDAQNRWYVENGVDYFGGDYEWFEPTAPDARVCRNACNEDAQCAAFTWTGPTTSEPRGRCYLKTVVTSRRAADCCVSGQKLPPTEPIFVAEENFDYYGNDIRDSPAPNAVFCERVCAANPYCNAYTFVRQVAGNRNGHCYLKASAAGRRADACCHSGRKLLGTQAIRPGLIQELAP